MTKSNSKTEKAADAAPALGIEYRPVADLVPFANNARTHDAKSIQAIAESIENYGFRKPLVIWRDNMVLAGHGALEAAKLRNQETVPCTDASHLTFTQAREFVIADNKTAELSAWDPDLLGAELESIAIDLHDREQAISLPGFTDADMLTYFNPSQFDGDSETKSDTPSNFVTEPEPVKPAAPREPAKAKATKPAAVTATPKTETPAAAKPTVTPITPPAPKTPRAVSRPGEVWTLGAHRLVCSGADPLEDLRGLLKTTPADLVLVNPHAMMTVPEEPQIMRAFDRIGSLLETAAPFLRVACPVYAAAGYTPNETIRLVETLEHANIATSRFLIGDTIGAALVGEEFPLRHRIVLYAHTAGTPKFSAHSDRASIIDWPALEPDRHSASLPESVITAALLSSTQKLATVLDLGGNGLELLAACEAQTREARILEADPLRCDAILQAFVDWTGEEPVCKGVAWSEYTPRDTEKAAA